MISGTISQEDYLDAQKLHRRELSRWIYGIDAVFALVGIVVLFTGPMLPGMMFLFAGLGAAIGEWATVHLYLPRKVRRLHRQQKDLATTFTFQWDAEFIEGHSSIGTSKRSWKNYAKCKESEEMFLLYHADNLFEMFPKRWFADPAQIDAFRVLARLAGS